ncbi:transcriptional regulator FtrA [Stella sp.]|uniref:transcriptional regulator FtrA n=1 Tax=Stella sp. TaxID=2912054 RepID=UPI0035B4F571
MSPNRTRPPNPEVAVVAYDGLCTFEFGIAVEVFGLPRPEMGADWYRFRVCAAEPGPIRAVGGIRIEAEDGLEALTGAGTVVVPGWRGAREVPPAPLLAALREAHGRGARLVSLCSGVFVLAATGLLDGRRATTHWRYLPVLAELHPAIRIAPDVLYVDEGDILTAAGSAAGIDLAIHIVRRDHGARAANQVARRLVLPPHREGGQAQYVERPVPAQPGSRLAGLLDRLRGRLGDPLAVPRLAAEAGMSERTFLRRFAEATGTTPGDWLVGERLAHARTLLEETDLPVERVATECGFGTAATLRHHFRARLGTAPRRYRERFRTA